MTRAAIYARFSTTMQREASIEDQVRICRERAALERCEVIEVFSDMAISGASTRRPGLQSLLALAERGGVDVILCEALDRLSRDQADVAQLYKRLSFHDVRIITTSEGEINELHVGLKGTMNQMFLKDLAAKTRRGLRGRVEAGKSGGGNAYGYRVVRGLGPDGQPVTGEREIVPCEAEVIRRIYQEFADGYSPKKIAQRLNADGISGPRGTHWRDTAIRGHRQRGTGIINNELYIGRLIWNRLRYVKDPETGKRVSRLNPEQDWVIHDVPELRIVTDALWDAVKWRQKEIDATPAVQGIRKSRFWEKKRSQHLLTGKLACGCCGGGFAAVGKDYLACSNARKLQTCSATRSIKRATLEDAALGLLRDRLMQPDAVAEFVTAFTRAANAQRRDEGIKHEQTRKALKDVERKLAGLYDAIADGLRTPGLLQKLQALEEEKAELERKLEAPAPSAVRFHPKLAELYRSKVTELSEALKDDTIRVPALNLLRSLIDRVVVHHDAGRKGVTLEVEGALSAMISQAQPGGLGDVDPGSVKLVAGVGFEPTTFRL